ncbi:MAG: hypothetical protein COT81_05175 [Candidatus Buchananbacteria bacterium CG10_big_fil_rev_8_21_14_0_10_42_9]|uniref:Thioredoxin domain-containing protein n=1 Tax=Candidatus Buchananbacteria bacterium CG10_big_fil_rev_8_21_14_0_10_42_9 TaxID=1974526 RepID=A0A2H0W012_9BACT|nr:MAG: hypothetical protein COT81_05175 [Candidatus Buchananbacteria bacterium CG10_big_fil_rev_8_21_14_0_10_42_9]
MSLKFIDDLKPRAAFYLGIMLALTVIFAVGFFGLLVFDAPELGFSLKGQKEVSADTGKTVNNSASPDSTGNSSITVVSVTKDDHILGDKKAPISIIEYSDAECPFCKRFHPTMQQIVAKYEGRVNWVYRHFPLASIHPKAPKEAEATECAAELGGNDGFWAYLDRLFEITPSNNNLDLARLPEIAEEVGLNADKFEECLNSGKYAKKVQSHYNQAIAAGGRGTPYSLVIYGDKQIPLSGALTLSQIESALAQIIE